MPRTTAPKAKARNPAPLVISLICAALLGWLALAQAAPALAQSSPWAQGEASRARLLAAGGLAQGRYLAGVDIRLAAGNLTYWKLPGDAGVPPVFSFEGSKNLASAQALYPAPRRFPEANGEAFGYKDEVLFPVMVTPVDPAKPVSLAVKLDYATCDRICIPAQAVLRLELAPGARASEEADLLRAWLARTPSPAGDPAAPRASVTQAQAPNGWHVRFAGEAPGDLFAEGPEDWFFDTKRTADGFDLILAQKPADAPAGPVVVTLTMVVGDRAFEARTTLDARRAKP